MDVRSAQDLLRQRLGDVHSSACFLAQHIPSMVSAVASEDLRKLLNLYLDVVRDNADRTEQVLKVVDVVKAERDPTAVPAMIDDLFDLIERIDEPALVDVAILFSSNEIGGYEAQRLNLLSHYANTLGQAETTKVLRESGQSLTSVCDQLRHLIDGDVATALSD